MAFVDIPQIVLHHNIAKNADGTCQRWHINGRMKIWKKEPGRFQIPIKRGLYEFGYVSNYNATDFHREEDCNAVSDEDLQIRSFRFEPLLGLEDTTNNKQSQSQPGVRSFSMPYPQGRDDTILQNARKSGRVSR